MVLRPRPKAQPRTSVSAHNAALHFLARPKQYALSDAERADLIQVVEGFTGPHDDEAARRCIEWMREHYRRLAPSAFGRAPADGLPRCDRFRVTRGQAVRFLYKTLKVCLFLPRRR
jgi:hypothetical protein